jgi:formate dehydrogenase subunit delta
MSPDRLIYMANQIGKFFESQGHDKAVPGIAEHICKFWDPRMRSKIQAHLDAGRRGARSRRARRARCAEAGMIAPKSLP